MSRPRILHRASDDWLQNTAGACPTMLLDALVIFQFACGKLSEHPRKARDFIWKKRGWDFDIKAAKVVGKAD
jgi:hypothetical protein